MKKKLLICSFLLGLLAAFFGPTMMSENNDAFALFMTKKRLGNLMLTADGTSSVKVLVINVDWCLNNSNQLFSN